MSVAKTSLAEEVQWRGANAQRDHIVAHLHWLRLQSFRWTLDQFQQSCLHYSHGFDTQLLEERVELEKSRKKCSFTLAMRTSNTNKINLAYFLPIFSMELCTFFCMRLVAFWPWFSSLTYTCGISDARAQEIHKQHLVLSMAAGQRGSSASPGFSLSLCLASLHLGGGCLPIV